jgi:hypothetical protein
MKDDTYICLSQINFGKSHASNNLSNGMGGLWQFLKNVILI